MNFFSSTGGVRQQPVIVAKNSLIYMYLQLHVQGTHILSNRKHGQVSPSNEGTSMQASKTAST
jgi:hypothetical protein